MNKRGIQNIKIKQIFIKQILPVWNVPSGIKKAPTVIPTKIRNLKNQNLKKKYFPTQSVQQPKHLPKEKQAELPPSINVEFSHDQQTVTRFEERHVGLCCYVHQPLWRRTKRRSRSWQSTCDTQTCSPRWHHSSPGFQYQVWKFLPDKILGSNSKTNTKRA